MTEPVLSEAAQRLVRKLLLFRHAPVAVKGLCYGHSAPPLRLSDDEACEVIYRHAGTPLRVISSPLERCLGPATCLARRLDLPLLVEPRLAEMHFGMFEGRLWSEIEENDAELLSAWMTNWETEAPPGGETRQSLSERVASFLEAEAEAEAEGKGLGDKHTLIVTHAGVVRALHVLAQGLSWSDALSLPVPHLEPITLDRFRSEPSALTLGSG